MTPEQDDSNIPDNDNVVLFGDRGETVMPEDAPLSIGNVARMLGVSRLRLWSYEIRGLISRRRSFGASPVYRWEDCARVAFIVKAREVGLSVRELAPVIKASDSAASVEAVKQARWTCLWLIERLDRRRQTLRHVLAEMKLFHDRLSERLPDADAAGTAAPYGSPESD